VADCRRVKSCTGTETVQQDIQQCSRGLKTAFPLYSHCMYVIVCPCRPCKYSYRRPTGHPLFRPPCKFHGALPPSKFWREPRWRNREATLSSSFTPISPTEHHSQDIQAIHHHGSISDSRSGQDGRHSIFIVLRIALPGH